MQTPIRVFPAEGWLFPNMPGGADRICLSAARGSYACCQLFLFSDQQTSVSWQISGNTPLPSPALFQLLPVTVNRNSCFLEDLDTQRTPLESLSQYYTKTAPFQVYDAMKPLGKSFLCAVSETALYLKWPIPSDIKPGTYHGELSFSWNGGSAAVPYEIQIASAVVPQEGHFQMINWIAPNAKWYQFTPFSSRHWDILKKLNTLACGARQTHVNLNASFFYFRTEKEKPVFQFDRAETYIQMCMKLGCRFIEGPSLKELCFSLLPGVTEADLIGNDCIAFLGSFLEQWYAFLQEHHYADITVQHIFDEPRDKNAEIYQRLGHLVKEKIPGIPTLDAVLTTNLNHVPDIMIPTTRFYQLRKQEFDTLAQNGRKLWLYTCCWPSAPYLNRFLDMPLLSVRYLHWLCRLLDIPAYLHWGFCFQADTQDVFTEPSIPFKIFDDSLEQYLPPGDTNIVYPLEGEPIGSVRLEMQRAGIEDFELLTSLDASQRNTLIQKCIRPDFTADTSMDLHHKLYQELLYEVSK